VDSTPTYPAEGLTLLAHQLSPDLTKLTRGLFFLSRSNDTTLDVFFRDLRNGLRQILAERGLGIEDFRYMTPIAGSCGMNVDEFTKRLRHHSNVAGLCFIYRGCL